MGVVHTHLRGRNEHDPSPAMQRAVLVEIERPAPDIVHVRQRRKVWELLPDVDVHGACPHVRALAHYWAARGRQRHAAFVTATKIPPSPPNKHPSPQCQIYTRSRNAQRTIIIKYTAILPGLIILGVHNNIADARTDWTTNLCDRMLTVRSANNFVRTIFDFAFCA